ncbi:MAG TPA: alkaline phosphatase family protein [Candidatus Sulfotelmatobacter sp.]|nr:alkaline phosphatase family protein [Candidatus Sulfotelmatobacter sp.]
MRTKNALLALAATFALTASLGSDAVAQGKSPRNQPNRIQRVLLVSIDGMHAVDYINCSQGVSGVNNGQPYCPNLAALGATGINYLDTSTSKPSDSFPGLTTIISGATPRLHGAFYDVAYDRVLAPPLRITGNGLKGGVCVPNQPNGTTTEYEEGIDRNQKFLNGIDGITSKNGDGGINSIDPGRLPRDPYNNCAPVYPWNFVRTNTIFGVIHQSGGYTAWSDKHPAYSSVSGPGDGTNVDDFYAPEINSNVVALPGIRTPLGMACDPVPDLTADLTAWTNSFLNIMCYDTLKVKAILNEIDAYNHNRTMKTQVPMVFGMNFQAVSVGQKLIEANVGSGGYMDATGTPSAQLLQEVQFVDTAIGDWTAELKAQGIYDSTLIIITAKHGQSPIDSQRYTGITSGGPVTTSPSQLIDSCLPASESNAGGQIGPTEDDISLLWLSRSCTTAAQVDILETQSPASANVAGIGQIFWGASLNQIFNPPGIPPTGDSRTPDIVITPNVGVTYSGSHKKQAEHGGFSHDDTSVMILVSNSGFSPSTITTPVQTAQVAPTVLQALGLNPASLQGVQQQGTQVLPGVFSVHK